MLNSLYILLITTMLAGATSAKPAVARLGDIFKTAKGDANLAESVSFVRVRDGKVLFAANPDTALIPASVTKLVTSATVAAKFSPAHRFKTKIFYSGTRNAAGIGGNIYFLGDGDPYFVSELIWQLASDIKNMGISEIRGDLVIDDKLFANKRMDNNRVRGLKYSQNAYDAEVSSMGVNFNTVAIIASAGIKNGAPGILNLDPVPLPHIRIVNRTKTVAANRGGKLRVTRKTYKGIDTITVDGAIALGSLPQKIYRSTSDGRKSSAEYLKAFLQTTGVRVRGKAVIGTIPKAAKFLLEVESYSMRKIVTGLNKFSNNFIADVLIKRMGAAFPPPGKTPDTAGSGTYTNGLRVIEKFLTTEVGLKADFVLRDGSGLSPENRLSSAHVTKLLSYMAKKMRLFPEYLASLPAAGWDGTLGKRFNGKGTATIQGKVRAKTGTLTKPVTVSALAGYLNHPEHGLVAFAVIQNGVKGKSQPSTWDLRQIQDKALASFIETKVY